jgi:hypothetical protein
MGARSLIRGGTGLFVVAAALVFLAAPAAGAADATPAEFEYHAADLLKDGSDEVANRTTTLVPEGTAAEGDVVRITLTEEQRDAFEITHASGTADGVGIDVDHTAETIEVTLTDLGGDGTVTDAEIRIEASLRATDAVASDAVEYDATPIGYVEENGTDLGLDGEGAIAVTITEAAEIGFTAEEIDKNIDGSFHEVSDYDQFVLTFSKDKVMVEDGDTINLSVNSDLIKSRDESAIGIRNAIEWTTQGDNISKISVSKSNSGILEDHADKITITIHTVNNESRLISNESIALNIEILIDEESLKYAANRYHRADFLEVDVEGENNTELTDNDDIRTESPLLVDIYPGEVEQFTLGGPESGSEIGISENRSVPIETIEDRFGNEIRTPTFEATLSGAEREYTDTGIEIDTADRDGLYLGRGRDIEPRIGVFDLTVEVTDVEGPATHADGAVTATVENLTIYPDDVTVRPVGPSKDFDVEDGEIGLAVDLNVRDERIDRLDIELRRTTGNGTVTVDETSGAPTRTDLWTETAYAGDGEMAPENVWVIERGLTAGDFDGGVRTYTLGANATGRYGIVADVMPYEGGLVVDETELRSSTAEKHGGATRGRAEVVATGPIAAVVGVDVRSDREFVGVEADPGGPVVVELGRFVDGNGNTVSNTDEAVTVGLGNGTIETDSGVGAGSVTAEVGPTPGDPAATVELDPTAIDATAVETGANATIAVAFGAGRQLNATDVTLVHRVTEPGGSGWYTGSLSQPATLYVDADGPRDFAQWDPETERYASPAAGESDVLGSDRIEAEHLHRGFYFRARDDGARLGFDFVTEGRADGSGGSGTVELGPGWHFGSSNYDVSAHAERNLAEDVNWSDSGFGADDEAFVVHDSDGDKLHDRTNGADIDGSTAPVGHDETYWIRVRDEKAAPLTREIVRPAFDEESGIKNKGG